MFAELAAEQPRKRFTVGINDDVSGSSVTFDPSFDIESPDTVRAVFFGLGSDGTVGANKNTIKILGAEEDLHAQGYFVYDSKKSGSRTVSHLRFGLRPIRAPYLVTQASFVGCHLIGLLDQVDVLGRAAPGATLLLNCTHPPNAVWDALSRPVQEQIVDKRIDVYTIDAARMAREAGLASELVAVWDPDSCIQCGDCSFVRPHSVIRSRYYDRSVLDGAPEEFRLAPLTAVGLPDTRFTLQVLVEDCTGCGLCAEACPVVAPGGPATRAINLGPREPLVVEARHNIAFFERFR